DGKEIDIEFYVNNQFATLFFATLSVFLTYGEDLFHVQSSGGDRTVEGADVLVAMYSERDSFAVYLLKRHQINRLTLT
ncbi:hypothetical protein RFZ03_14910, partial [Acinetobacter baumannii]|nr:hypothetical protein [Acinetobacter baumannii]